MNLMILAAGLGTRLRPYTLELPKPAIPFLGAPLASYSLSLLDGIKINRLVVNSHHLPDKIEALFRELKLPAKSLHFSLEGNQILGSGGGINNARSLLADQGDFLVMNGDEVILPHDPWMLKEFLAYHKWSKSIATLLVMKHPEVGKKFGGVWVEEGKDQVKCFAKTPIAGLCGYHYLGVLAFQDKIFRYFKNPLQSENILYDTLTMAISQHEQVSIYCCETEWFENGTVEDFVSSASYYCDQLTSDLENKTNLNYWKTYLAGTLRYYGTEKKVVENNFPELSQKLDRLWQALKINSR